MAGSAARAQVTARSAELRLSSSARSLIRSAADCSGSRLAAELAGQGAPGVAIPGPVGRPPASLTLPDTRRRCYRALGRRCGLERAFKAEIGRIKVVLTGDADQREQGIAAGIGQGRAHPLGIGGLGDRADRPVRGDPFARGMREHRGQIDHAASLSMAVVCTVAISCWPSVLRTMSRPLESGA